MNFTREQVAHLRRLIEVSTEVVPTEILQLVERLADVLDAQLDMDAGIDLLSKTDAELDALERDYQRSQIPF